MISRRVVLFGVGGALLLSCGGGLAWLNAGYHLPEGDVPLGLSRKDLAIVRAIVETLCPADGDLPSGLAIGVHQRIDEEVWSQSAVLRKDLVAAIELIEHLPPVYGYFGRFSGLSQADREAYFRALLLSGPTPVVQAAIALKQLCLLFYYTRSETWSAIGYDGPWVQTAKPPESSLRYAELLREAQ